MDIKKTKLSSILSSSKSHPNSNSSKPNHPVKNWVLKVPSSSKLSLSSIKTKITYHLNAHPVTIKGKTLILKLNTFELLPYTVPGGHSYSPPPHQHVENMINDLSPKKKLKNNKQIKHTPKEEQEEQEEEETFSYYYFGFQPSHNLRIPKHKDSYWKPLSTPNFQILPSDQFRQNRYLLLQDFNTFSDILNTTALSSTASLQSKLQVLSNLCQQQFKQLTQQISSLQSRLSALEAKKPAAPQVQPQSGQNFIDYTHHTNKKNSLSKYLPPSPQLLEPNPGEPHHLHRIHPLQ